MRNIQESLKGADKHSQWYTDYYILYKGESPKIHASMTMIWEALRTEEKRPSKKRSECADLRAIKQGF